MSTPIHKRDSAFVAEGLTVGPYKKTAVLFERETHETIRALAIKHGTSFAEQVRTLVEWGLEHERAG